MTQFGYFFDFRIILFGVRDDKIVAVAGVESFVENAAGFSVRLLMLEPIFGYLAGRSLRAFADQVPLGPVLTDTARATVPYGEKRICGLVDTVFKDDLIELAAVVVDLVDSGYAKRNVR